MLTRRSFIKGSLLTNFFLLSSGFVLQGCRRKETSELRFLSQSEAQTLSQFAQRVLPPGGDIPLSAEETQVVNKIDNALSVEDKDTQKQFTAALFIFEFAPLLSLHFSRFSNLSEENQIKVMNGWMRSRWDIKRNIFNALKDLCMFMYYTTPSVWQYMGYEGPLIKR
jgi:hypothetical protein